MNKIAKLEQRWKMYKAKKVILLFLFLSILYAFGAGGYYTFLNWNSINSFFSKKNALEDMNTSLITENNTSKENVLEKKILTTEMVKKDDDDNKTLVEELSLKPIIPIIDMEKERANTPRKPMRHKEKVHSTRVKAKPSTYLTAEELSKVKASNNEERDTTRLKKIHLRSTSKHYIETMKKKFFKSKNSRDALLLAKAFYRETNYKESEKWALEANQLDSHLDESWILFAQSKAKMGKTNEAIKILAMYYKKSKSPKVRVVLEKIKTGRL